MASKLSSRAASMCSSHEGNVEWGAFGAKSDPGHSNWDEWRQREGWLNDVFCNDSIITSDCNSVAMQVKAPASVCNKSLSELDWLFKEMAFREFFLGDGTKAWHDLNSAGCHFSKDTHNIDTYSNLAAVAALFKDWCMEEEDFFESVAYGKTSNSDGRCMMHMNFNDSKFGSGREADHLASVLVQSYSYESSSLSSTLGNVLNECYKSYLTQSGLFLRDCACQFPKESSTKEYDWNVHGSERGSFGKYPRSNSEQEVQNYEQFSWIPLDGKHEFVSDSFLEEDFLTVDDSSHDSTGSYECMGKCQLYGKDFPAASRYSFGRDSSVGYEGSGASLKNAGMSLASGIAENPEVSSCFSECNQINNSAIVGYGGQDHGSKVEQFNIQGEDLVPEGLMYALSYMNLHDLLTLEKVCKSLQSRIKNDILLWQRLHVELPMSNNLTDEVLLELASRSRGQLQCLSLLDCTRVTEAALEKVVLSSPRLVKLCLPGCSRITADAVIRIVERHTNKRDLGIPTLKQIRVRNMDGFTKAHLEKLQKILVVNTQEQVNTRKARFYHQKHCSSSQDDGRAIDVEECPICNHVRLVYDCTRDRCQQKKGGSIRDCRGCILCIVRCEACGRCITDNDYEETFSLDVLCSCCWHGLPTCTECNRPASGCHVDHFLRTSGTTFVCCGTSSKTEESKLHVSA